MLPENMMSSTSDLFAASSMTLQIAEDMERLYGRPISSRSSVPEAVAGNSMASLLGGIKKGEVTIVAIPNDHLREAFCRGAIQHVALTLRQPVAFFSFYEAFSARFLRWVGGWAGFSLGTNIYDGRLSKTEYWRLSLVLDRLTSSSMFSIPANTSSLTQIRDLAKGYCEKTGEVGVVLIDYLQCITDDPHAAIVELKNLARELDLPVVALYKLYPRAEIYGGRNASVTSEKVQNWRIPNVSQIPAFLRKGNQHIESPQGPPMTGYIDKVISESDTFVYMKGAPDEPIFLNSSNAKQVGWIERLRNIAGI